MTDLLIPEGSYFFWGFESSEGGGIAGEHLPFNKVKAITIPNIKYETKPIHTASANQHAAECTIRKIIEEMEIECEFQSPFILLALTQYNTVTAVWTGTGDAITGGFTATTHRKSIWVQVHMENASGSNDLDLTFKGGYITEYHFIIQEGEPIIEKFRIKFQDVADAAQAPDIDDGLDDGAFNASGIDGGYAIWDGTENAVITSSSCTVTFNSAALAGINWTRIDFPILVPREFKYVGSSQIPQVIHDAKEWPQPVIEVEGYGKGDQDITQILTTYESKTKATFKIQYGTTKYLQYTNTFTSHHAGFNNQGEKGTLYFPAGAGYAFTYSWTANEATDPSDYINHADP